MYTFIRMRVTFTALPRLSGLYIHTYIHTVFQTCACKPYDVCVYSYNCCLCFLLKRATRLPSQNLHMASREASKRPSHIYHVIIYTPVIRVRSQGMHMARREACKRPIHAPDDMLTCVCMITTI